MSKHELEDYEDSENKRVRQPTCLADTLDTSEHDLYPDIDPYHDHNTLYTYEFPILRGEGTGGKSIIVGIKEPDESYEINAATLKEITGSDTIYVRSLFTTPLNNDDDDDMPELVCGLCGSVASSVICGYDNTVICQCSPNCPGHLVP